MDICEKIAYIKGLADGLDLDTNSKEGKIIAAIVDLLGDITEEICDIEDACDELYEVECPSCNDIIYLDADMLEDEGIDCPNCGTHLEFDFDCDCCDDDCDCCSEDAE